MGEPALKIFDTLSYAKKLKQAGFTEQQAEVQAETFLTIVEDHLVTKRDLKELEVSLKRDIEESRIALTKDMESLKVELKRDMESLKVELKRDMESLKVELKRDMEGLNIELKKDMEIMRRDMKIWFGSLLAVGVATLGALVTIITTVAH